jgi:hypothetical protein
MQFRTQPRKLPMVFSIEEVSNLLMAAPGPGHKYGADPQSWPLYLDPPSPNLLCHATVLRGMTPTQSAAPAAMLLHAFSHEALDLVERFLGG